MTLLYPLGLLGLLAIPVLILIYILKNKHTEQVISSTYIWKLSERFLKRKNPISRITGVISLILQILAVALLSFAVSRPIFTIPNAADDYVFILDGSGSMHYEEGSKTRFELGKAEIQALIEDSADGSSYTLITAGEAAGVAFEGVTEKAQALSVLENVEPSTSTPNFGAAHGYAQGYFTQNPASKIYLVTDKAYESLQNVELINVSSRQENYALCDLAYAVKQGKLTVTGKATSYESDKELTLALYLDEQESATTKVSVAKLEEKEFSFEVNTTSFQAIEVRILDEDGLPMDNQSKVFRISNTTENKVLIVTSDEKSPDLLLGAMRALLGKDDAVEFVYANKYDGSKTGYQLYIFEGYTPETLPENGAVWFVNPQTGIARAGFSVQGRESLINPAKLQFNPSTSTRIRQLLKDTVGSSIAVGKSYVKCSFYRNFYTMLSLDGNPMIAAGTNDYNNRTVVFSFDMHSSDFALSFDYMVLMRNLFQYTFPSIVTETSYYCGGIVPINVLTNSESIRIDSPSGGISYLDTAGDLAEYALTEVGTYKITQMVGGNAQTAYVYSNFPKEERASQVEDSSFIIQGEPSSARRDGTYDGLIVLLILLAVVVLADWGVYCYEQYQLR